MEWSELSKTFPEFLETFFDFFVENVYNQCELYILGIILKIHDKIKRLQKNKWLSQKQLVDVLQETTDYLLSDTDDGAEEIKIHDQLFVDKIRLLNS